MKIDLSLTARPFAILVATVLVATDPLNNVADAQSPVAHWTFDQGISDYSISDAIDVVGGYNGVWQDEVSEGVPDFSGLGYVAGQIGGGVAIAGGGNQHWVVPSITELQGIAPTPFGGTPVAGVGITMTAWINVAPDAVDQYDGILVTRTASNFVGEELEARTNQNWGLAWEDRPASGPSALSHIDVRVGGQAVDSAGDSIVRGTWHHIAMVWGNVGNLDSETSEELPSQRLYVDGQLVGETADTNVVEFADATSWLIGEDSCCAEPREFRGFLDDLAIFASALTTTEIQNIYNNGLIGTDASGTATGLLSPGDVDGIDGVTIADYNIILENLGETATSRIVGDLNGDRIVNLADYQIWREDSGLTPSQIASLTGGTVPEPSSLLLVGLVSISALSWHRVKRPVQA